MNKIYLVAREHRSCLFSSLAVHIRVFVVVVGVVVVKGSVSCHGNRCQGRVKRYRRAMLACVDDVTVDVIVHVIVWGRGAFSVVSFCRWG